MNVRLTIEYTGDGVDEGELYTHVETDPPNEEIDPTYILGILEKAQKEFLGDY